MAMLSLSGGASPRHNTLVTTNHFCISVLRSSRDYTLHVTEIHCLTMLVKMLRIMTTETYSLPAAETTFLMHFSTQ